MRFIRWFLCFIAVIHSVFATAGSDIILKSRFDIHSSQIFIEQLRHFLINNNFGDPYAQKFEKPIVIDLIKTIGELPRDTQEWINDFQSVLDLKMFESEYRVVIDDLSYSINNFNSEVLPRNSSANRIEYVTKHYVNGLNLSASRLSFEVVLNRTQSKQPIRFSIELIEPEFKVSPELVAEVSMGWMTSILPDKTQLSLDTVDIKKLMRELVKRPQLIDLNVKDIIIPDISIKIGKKKIVFDQDKIEAFLTRREDDLKKGVLDLLNSKLSDKFSNVIKDQQKDLYFPRSFGFKSDISGVFVIEDMLVKDAGLVDFDFNGYFCQREIEGLKDLCPEDKVKTKERRIITEAQYSSSIEKLNQKLVNKKANLAVSVSENYLNQLIDASILAGLWEDMLKDTDFALGPEKAFILAENEGETFSLYLDIIHKLKGTQRILVGKSEIRFPIKFAITVNIEERGGFPHLLIDVKDILITNDMILNGLPEYDLISTVGSVPRFKNKVLKQVKEEVASYQGENLLDLELQELTGTYFKQLEFFSDGLGRGTAIIGFE